MALVNARVAPAALTPTDLYTVPVNTQLVVAYIGVANRGANSDFNIAIRPNGAVLANPHYIYFEHDLVATSGVEIMKGTCLNAGDVITVQGKSANFSFNMFGELLDV